MVTPKWISTQLASSYSSGLLRLLQGIAGANALVVFLQPPALLCTALLMLVADDRMNAASGQRSGQCWQLLQC